MDAVAVACSLSFDSIILLVESNQGKGCMAKLFDGGGREAAVDNKKGDISETEESRTGVGASATVFSGIDKK